MPVSFEQIVAARSRIESGILRTPCKESQTLSELFDCQVFTKLEYLQRTGSFKERGARNALLLLPSERRANGVIAASAGNHALALAHHGRDLGIPVTVCMPIFAPLVKQTRCRQLGARVILTGTNIAEAKIEADRLVELEGLTYVHGFDGLDVIAGAGTLGLEILDQVPEPDAVVVPIGGAGLIAGMGLAMKTMRSGIELIGVEPAYAQSYTEAVKAGKPVTTIVHPTLGDGLAVPCVGVNAFELAQRFVDRVVLVDESQIALAILRLIELEKGVVEGAGAAPLSAMLSGQLTHLKGKKVVLVLCGGNIDPAVLDRVIDFGLVADGRLSRFTAVISDRPGGLAAFTQVVAEAGAGVKQIEHERLFASADMSKVTVVCTIETRDRDHAASLHASLRAEGFEISA
ncbi:MAG: pyridoxal-phosphate dependent enzyme [Chlorobia bacterium]|nr:pyridoxal-phosphate dependent enzyme [Fimbriimonadaceae bacterium]